MTVDEQLSALLDGDLPPEEADRLLARIDADPDLADRWEALQALVLDLEALPPPEVDEARVRAALGDPPRHEWWRPSVVWPLLAAAAAAGLVLGLWWAPGTVTVIQVTDEGVVVEAPALSIDGEPVPGGRIQLRADRGEILVESLQAPTGPDASNRPDPHPSADRTGGPSETELGRLRDEVASLRARLEAHEGRPLPWPTAVPALLMPAAFEEAVRAEVERHPDVQVRGFDCSEFPCAVVLSDTQDFRVPARDWPSILYPLTDRLPEPWSVIHTVRTHDADEMRTEVAVLAILDPALETSENERLLFRARSLIERFQPEEMRDPQ